MISAFSVMAIRRCLELPWNTEFYPEETDQTVQMQVVQRFGAQFPVGGLGPRL
jgi:hypothetical protein